MDCIRTYLVNGFLDSGKTSYIQDCIFSGWFHKHGSTLILSFEDGETGYDSDRLRDFRTEVVNYEGREDISAFCLSAIERFRPDRVYIEMNVMTEDLPLKLPPQLETVFAITLFDGSTLPLYYNNMRQLLQNMIQMSNMAVFNRCPDKEALAPYAVPFRLMNPRGDFLWQSELGYSEKAFGRMLPYDLSASELNITEEDYPVFHLDIHENPQNYTGKQVSFDAQVMPGQACSNGNIRMGRSVMTCCIRDIQFLGFDCILPQDNTVLLRDGNWFRITAEVCFAAGKHSRTPALRILSLQDTPDSPASVIGFSSRS